MGVVLEVVPLLVVEVLTVVSQEVVVTCWRVVPTAAARETRRDGW